MEQLTANPFKFGNPVEGEFYLPRPALTLTIRQFLENRIPIVLMGPRRFGKTSFVLNLFGQMEKEGYHCLFIDIFNITSHRDFLQQFLRAIRAKKTFKDVLKVWWEKLRRLKPQLSADLDPLTGNPSLSVTFAELDEQDAKTAIQDLLDGLSSLGNKVIVALDEFQKISEIEDDGWLEATLRTHIQRLKGVSFLFTGSRKSLISEMLNSPSRPLYRSCQMIDFPRFGEEFSEWVINRFQTVGVNCNRNAIEYLREHVQDTPNYVQMVCFQLVAQARSSIDISDISEVLKTVTQQNAYAYQTLLNSLTLPQQRALRLAANKRRSLFQKEFLSEYEITSSAALHSSIKALKTKGILDEEGTAKGNVVFDDPLFAYWIRLSFGGE